MANRVCLTAEYCNNRIFNTKAKDLRLDCVSMRLFVLFVTMLVLSACGKTGDLYLPDENVPAKEPAEKTTPTAEQ